MANLNKAVLIQLKDIDIVDISTELVEEHDRWSSGCPTCGSFDFERSLHKANIILSDGRVESRLFHEDSEFYESDEREALQVSEADLMKLFLDHDRLQQMSEMTLEQFLSHVKQELSEVVKVKQLAFWGE